jgi:putative oxidoreductase
MDNQQKNVRTINISLWITQIVLAVLLLSGAIMKFLPIEKISVMMPWTGEVPAWMVRALGLIDLSGAAGLILPGLFRIKPILTAWTALGIITLMFSAVTFHVSRGEAPVIGVNVFCMVLAGFIAWGRFSKVKEISGL